MQEIVIVIGAAAVFAIDQMTKALALTFLGPPDCAGGRSGLLQLTENERGARMPTDGRAMLSLWSALGALVLVTSVATGTWPWPLIAGSAMLLGGATGNLIDRRRRRAVVDFVALGSWPRFNLADVALTVGVGLIVFGAITW